MVREDRPGDVRLVGYVVPKPDAEYTDSELRKHLRRTLPDYMVPQNFVAMETLPLTPNGKVDRKALPAPQGIRAAVEGEYVAPRTPSEQLLAGHLARGAEPRSGGAARQLLPPRRPLAAVPERRRPGRVEDGRAAEPAA